MIVRPNRFTDAMQRNALILPVTILMFLAGAKGATPDSLTKEAHALIARGLELV